MDKGQLIMLGQSFAAHAGLELSTVSTYAANDGKWLNRLQGGASCTLRKAAVVVQWFSDHWPTDLEWPADIPRPPQSREAA
ncbi:hypothetical protein [Gemmobacter denitrificans]|uniref:YdaS antitoxin of YdaST toxin-antitoxin system n=1 Tax=Gemmobacter denitrificans TaxID=3123040 RepID=A0ABU8C1C0_9RHOB